MTCYVVALLRITERDQYDRYSSGFLSLFERSKGVRILAADEHPAIFEGDWDDRKIVILEFADDAAYENFMLSEDYERISAYRRAGTEGVMLVARGLG